MIPIFVVASATLQAEGLSKQVASLATQRDPDRLEAAAVAVASSGDAKGIHELAKRLGMRQFLSRLDPSKNDQLDIDHLVRVFVALGEHPNSATEALCIGLADNEVFASVPERLNPLLNALAAVRPLSGKAAAVFRKTSQSGYLGVNGPLLAKNASPLALAVFEDLMSEANIAEEDRVDVAHRSLLPMRTDPSVVEMCGRIVLSHTVSSRVRTAILETLFDYQPKQWFGVAMNQPAPPSWSSADAGTRNALRLLGNRIVRQSEIPDRLKTAIQKTLAQLN